MAGPELLLDSSIRIWVVLPIVFITFVFGIIRHYLSLLMASDKTVSIDQVRDGYNNLHVIASNPCWLCLSYRQVMMRSRCLRENGQYIPQSSFEMRRNYLLDKESPIVKGKDKPGQVSLFCVLFFFVRNSNLLNDVVLEHTNHVITVLE